MTLLEQLRRLGARERAHVLRVLTADLREHLQDHPDFDPSEVMRGELRASEKSFAYVEQTLGKRAGV